MSAEIIKGPFWSNCLLEAAKAKIQHPFKVKVTVVPRSEARCPHFLWSDGKYDYDFGVERRLVGAQLLLFRGYIRRRGLGFNQKYKERMRKAWSRPPERERGGSCCAPPVLGRSAGVAATSIESTGLSGGLALFAGGSGTSRARRNLGGTASRRPSHTGPAGNM